MRAIRTALATAALVLAFGGEANAQDWWWGISYNMTAPSTMPASSDLGGEFVSDFSFRGIGLEARYVPRRGSNVSYGFTGAWHVLKTETSETVNLPSADVTGYQLRYVNSVPLLANATYYFGEPRRGVRPYVGLNLGTYYMERRVEIGLAAITDKNWHLGWAPEAGVVVPLGRPEAAMFASIRYNWAFSAGGSGDQKYWGFNVGFAYR